MWLSPSATIWDHEEKEQSREYFMKKSDKRKTSDKKQPEQHKTSKRKTTDSKLRKTPKKAEKPRKKTSDSSAIISKLEADLVEVKAENAALRDRLLRAAAELDNLRKRTEKEIGQIIQNANSQLILDLLPVVDDLERSLKTSDIADAASFRNGIELIYQKMGKILKKNGVEPMESVGQDFDVNKHDALLQIKSSEAESGKIIEEHEKGYLLNGHVLRHAKVIVSQ